ncbi:MAG: extracellular solute-binding protein [bacterium]
MMDEKKKITRRKFLAQAAAATAGIAATGSLSTVASWAAPLTSKQKIIFRQDLMPDLIMATLLSGFSKEHKGLSATSSYVNSDRGWEYDRARTDRAPEWYTEGGSGDVFLARGPALAQLADEGTICPLDEFIDSSSGLSRDDYHRSRYGSVLDSATYKEKLWGIPIYGNPYALFCNIDLFSAAGIKNPPTTWEKTVEIARRCTRDTNGDGKPDVFGYSQCSFQFPLEIFSSGLNVTDPVTGLSTFGSEDAVDALDIYRRVHEYSPNHVNFEKGDMAMKISVTSNMFGLYKHINYFIAPLPAGKRRANTYGDSGGIYALAISARATPECKAAAWKLIEYLTSESMFFKISAIDRALPLRNSILKGERYSEYLKRYPLIKTFVDELEYAVPKPCIPQYRFIEVVMREILLPVQTSKDPMALTRAQLREHLLKQAERVNEKLRS